MAVMNKHQVGSDLNTVKTPVKIGRPGYCVTKQYDSYTKQRSLLFQIKYPEIEDLAKPRHRFIAAALAMALFASVVRPVEGFIAIAVTIIVFVALVVVIDRVSSSLLSSSWYISSTMGFHNLTWALMNQFES
ncbi:hypothetical protein Sjap_005712 [Stephania japonica]|uniref:SF3A2 domain-containing protein n=1 Tax=Stephania japonica TaxID=461633 RepID=A0AAP0PKD4_9MAGN